MASETGDKSSGHSEGRLAVCPNSPNCVSTRSEDPEHAIQPYRYERTHAEAKAMLMQVISGLGRVKWVKEAETSLHYEFTSFLFRFVDDVEFLLDYPTQTIHFRSASRIGHSDFGVNRKRMEEIRKLLEGKL
ncbi:MAG: DUF1499 domain-containing protein [Nitrospiraceae bacterium]